MLVLRVRLLAMANYADLFQSFSQRTDAYGNGEAPEFQAGTVWLVGAGPGAMGLLPLEALAALSQATVVVHDALIPESILKLANHQAKRLFAGKRGGKPSAKQDDISRLLIELAQQNECVLRLKGGDPFVFGRGVDECIALTAAGINFRITPGITAGIGGLSKAMLPLTSRDTNKTVTFVTGHSASGEVPDDLDWYALAKGSEVLVWYMGLRHLQRISTLLMEHGRDPDDLVAIVSGASLPEERILITHLRDCADKAKAAGISPPAIILMGPVVALREQLRSHALSDRLPNIDTITAASGF